MKSLQQFIFRFTIGLVLSGALGFALFAFIKYYDVIFAEKVIGEIFKVERVTTNVAYITDMSQNPSPQMFSFAVGIKDRNSGQIWTSSSEDRQWAVAKEGLCVEAEFLPYPPWNLQKKGTYHGARMIRLFECGRTQ